MILSRFVGSPRAAMEERTLSWDEVQQALRCAFFSGEEPDTGRSGAERLSPVAAAHRILTNSFGLIPFGLYRKNGEERVPVDRLPRPGQRSPGSSRWTPTPNRRPARN